MLRNNINIMKKIGTVTIFIQYFVIKINIYDMLN